MKEVLDVCCGGRQFWFNKAYDNALYLDIRKADEGILEVRPNFKVQPDMIMDFRDLKFDNDSFNLVVFDPPFRKFVVNSVMGIKYGSLEMDNWEEYLTQGFEECWRVLKKGGTLIFKWGEQSVKVADVVKIFSQQPLFGNRSGKGGKTHWLVYYKEMK